MSFVGYCRKFCPPPPGNFSPVCPVLPFPSRGVSRILLRGGTDFCQIGKFFMTSAGALGFKGVWGLKPPVGSRGEAPVGGLGDEVPPEAEAFGLILSEI